jgi:hypothetical protein
MSNPWLQIPLEDYEEHMALPSIGQAQMLADQFERLVEQYRPASVAIVGCAGGNGLERIETGTIERIVAVDINPAYIEAVRQRHGQRFARFEPYCADLQSEALNFGPVDMIYAALLFEYVDAVSTLTTLKRNCRSGGMLATVLQLSHAEQAAISPSPYSSLSSLASVMRLVAPADLRNAAEAVGFVLEESQTLTLPSGKRFDLMHLRG